MARPGRLEPIQACSGRGEQAVDAKVGSDLPPGPQLQCSFMRIWPPSPSDAIPPTPVTYG